MAIASPMAAFENLPGHFAQNLIPRQPALELFQDDPHHDSGALECGLPAADFRVSNDVPAKFNPALGPFPIHVDAPHCAPEGSSREGNSALVPG